MSVDFSGSDDCSCRIAQDDRADSLIRGYRDQGLGYKKIHTILCSQGFPYSRFEVQQHCQCVPRTVLTAIGDIEDQSVEVPADYFASRGIDLPEGYKFVAATVTDVGANGLPVWVRVKPETEEIEERVEIRQAQPILLPERPRLTVYVPTKYRHLIVTPDLQLGYFRDHTGEWHGTHDERALDVVHQVAVAVAESDGLSGWYDCGDFADLAAPSRFSPTSIDTQVDSLNKTWQRGAEEFARRRWVVGEEGEVVVLGGNHDIRLRTKANQEMPYLVGMKRANDPDDEAPVLSPQYLMRARDYNVEWCPSYPSGYRRISSNLLVFHSPVYSSKAMESARKLAHRVHASVIFGHVHRREAIAENVETVHGNRTMEVWTDGCLARLDGGLPAANNTYNEYGDRMLAGQLPEKWGVLSQAMQQGFSIVHTEVGGRERFSVERVAIWDGWCQFRGVEFHASCDVEGNPLIEAAA